MAKSQPELAYLRKELVAIRERIEILEDSLMSPGEFRMMKRAEADVAADRVVSLETWQTQHGLRAKQSTSSTRHRRKNVSTKH